MNKKLPEDLKRFVRGTVLRKVALFLACTFVYSVLLLLFGKFVLHTERAIALLVGWLLGESAIFFLLRLPALLADKTFYGTVAKAIVKTKDSRSLTIGLASMYEDHIVDLIVTLPDGKLHYKSVTVIEDKAAVRAGLDSYKEGDAVFHLRGTPHTILLPKESDTTVQCAVCGRVNDKHGDACEKCGHTLVKAPPAL